MRPVKVAWELGQDKAGSPCPRRESCRPRSELRSARGRRQLLKAFLRVQVQLSCLQNKQG